MLLQASLLFQGRSTDLVRMEEKQEDKLLNGCSNREIDILGANGQGDSATT